MASSTTKLFILGATGYIGGSVLQRIFEHPKRDSFEITALVRNADKAKYLKENYGLNTVVGHTAEFDKLATLSEQADIVLSLADSDDLAAIEAVFRGLRAKYEKTGVRGRLIHTSGTGLLTDQAKGMWVTDKIYDDSRPEDIDSLPDDAFHRNVDLPIVKADAEGFLRGYLVTPPTIFGLGHGPLFDAGIAHKHSQQIPTLIRTSIARGQGGIVGKGLPIWNSVSIDDLADFYVLLIEAVAKDPEAVPHGREGFYITETGEHTWYDIAKAVATALYEAGAGKSPEPTPLTEDELLKYIGSVHMGYLSLGSNARGRGRQALKLGWKPKYGNKELIASIKPEVEAILKEVKGSA
ncbi:NAD-P-binding protein [Trametes meyenii]|nr:NAD-P-binding protein [Trametes meyenii]